jgi:hypothetical protein
MVAWACKCPGDFVVVPNDQILDQQPVAHAPKSWRAASPHQWEPLLYMNDDGSRREAG